MKKLIFLFLLFVGLMGCEDVFAQVDGALFAAFSVSDSKKVYFSKGNLQYSTAGTHVCADGSTQGGTWRIAEHQYDVVGDSNINVASDYAGWIDLFGWGTSGYHDDSDAGNLYYFPYSRYAGGAISGNVNDYGFGPSTNMADPNLTGASANYDWGVFNVISNGGDETGLWRVLTHDEWVYLLESRDNATDKWGFATVGSVGGLMIIPDAWSLPNGCSFNSGLADGYSTNLYSVEQWAAMEVNGAVFLPGAGSSEDFNMLQKISNKGFYWSSSYWSSSMFYQYFGVAEYNSGCAQGLMFRVGGSNALNLWHDLERCTGFSVRLVMDEEVYKSRNAAVNLRGSAMGGAINVYAKGKKIVIENAIDEVEVYDVMGRLIKRGVLTEVSVPASGVYVVRVGGDVRKVSVR